MTDASLGYCPSRVSPPGATLRDWMDERGWGSRDLAQRMCRPVQVVNRILAGKTTITEDVALDLENVLGVPAQFWLVREAQYRLHLTQT